MTETLAWKVPAKLDELVTTALNAGRSYLVNHGEDTSGNPYVAVHIKWEHHEVRATWHTRNTGSYRLFSALATVPNRSWHNITATQAIEIVRGTA